MKSLTTHSRIAPAARLEGVDSGRGGGYIYIDIYIYIYIHTHKYMGNPLQNIM